MVFPKINSFYKKSGSHLVWKLIDPRIQVSPELFVNICLGVLSLNWILFKPPPKVVLEDILLFS